MELFYFWMNYPFKTLLLNVRRKFKTFQFERYSFLHVLKRMFSYEC